MSDAEPIYSVKAVRERLGVSDGMLRRYAITLESVTGESIKQHPRDGRQYTGGQVATLERSKLRVAEKRGRDAASAIRLALGQTEEDAEATMSLERTKAQVSPDVLVAALEPVITPLLTELRALRASNERLTDEVAGLCEHMAARAAPGFPGAHSPHQWAAVGILEWVCWSVRLPGSSCVDKYLGAGRGKP